MSSLRRLRGVLGFVTGSALLIQCSSCRSAPVTRDAGHYVATIPMPADSLGAFEPHIAVDPQDATRATVVAAGYRWRAEPRSWCATTRAWTTRTSGRHWSRPQDLGLAAFGDSYDPSHSDFTLDPVVSAGPGEHFFAVVIGGRAARNGAPARSNDLVLLQSARDGPFAYAAQVHGTVRNVRTNQQTPECGTTVFVDSTSKADRTAPFGYDASVAGHADKPWVAVDQGSGATRGFLGVAWSVAVDSTGERFALYAATKRSNEPEFRTPVLVSSAYRGLVHGAQIGIRKDGSVDLFWAENTSGRRVVRYAQSRDDGASYSDPVDVIQRPATAGQIRGLTLAYYFDLPVLCWTERQSRRNDQSRRVHENLWCSRTEQGAWQPAQPVGRDSLGFDKLTLGALAANQGGLWLLVYRSGANRTHVDLLHSDGAAEWRQHTRLASRRMSAADYELGGPVAIGDYVGLAAAHDRLYAAYVLPADTVGSRTQLYVSTVSVPPIIVESRDCSSPRALYDLPRYTSNSAAPTNLRGPVSRGCGHARQRSAKHNDL